MDFHANIKTCRKILNNAIPTGVLLRHSVTYVIGFIPPAVVGGR